MTWQLRRLHAELDALDKKRGDVFRPGNRSAASSSERSLQRDRAIRRILLERLLRGLPRRLGFRDARAFVRAFARANHLLADRTATRRRLTAAQVQELERRVFNQESAAQIAGAIGCAEQTVLNRATQFRKRLTTQHEQDASGI